MNITIEIKAPELVSAIEKLAQSLGQAPTVGVVVDGKEVAEKVTPDKKADPKKETPVKEEPKKETKPKKEEKAPEISLEVVRTKLSQFASENKENQLAVKDALSRFGVKKLTDVEPSDYKELLELVGVSV